jgi:hypothetical protein
MSDILVIGGDLPVHPQVAADHEDVAHRPAPVLTRAED